jgi:hypothetical protein
MIIALQYCFAAGFIAAVITSPIVIPWVVRRLPDQRRAPAKRMAF